MTEPKFWCEQCGKKREFDYVEDGEKRYSLDKNADPIATSEEFDMDENFYRCTECSEEYSKEQILRKGW